MVNALFYRYRPPLASDKPEDEQLAREMMEKVNKPNALQLKVEKGKFSSRGRGWLPMQEPEIPEFPRLDLSYLRALTFGVYQIKQARHYTDEHLTGDGQYEVSITEKLQLFMSWLSIRYVLSSITPLHVCHTCTTSFSATIINGK